MNIFSGLIDANFKNLYNQAIESLLSSTALAVPCKLKYNTTDQSFCTNCLYNPIVDKSFNKYNGSGPLPFPEGSICPVCNGFGKIIYDAEETVYLGVILDSKYWLNWGPKNIQIPNLAAQTLCSITLMPKLQNATQMVVADNEAYDNNQYSKAGPPIPMGLGEHKFILTNWTRP